MKSGAGSDTFNVETVPDGAPLIIDSGDKNDTVNLDVLTDTATHDVTVDGQGGVDALEINGVASATNHTCTVTGTSVTRINQAPAASLPATVHYANVENLKLTTGTVSAYDTINVLGTSAATTVNPIAGLNTITVGNTANRLDDLKGPLTVSSAYILIVNDQGTTATRPAYVLTGSSVTRDATTISYGPVLALTVNGGSGTSSSTFAIQGTRAPQTLIQTGTGADQVSIAANASTVGLSVYDGGGGDTVVLGQGGSVAGLKGQIFLGGTLRQLTVDDRNDTTAHPAITIGDTFSSGLLPGTLQYTALAMDYYLGSGRNDVAVLGAFGGVLDIHGNSGVDNVTVRIAIDYYPHTVRFEGQSTDSLTIDDSARTDSYLYAVTASTVSRKQLNFLVPTTIQFPGVGRVVLHGSQGTNTLDYAAYPTGVTVNLATGQATGFAAISNIRDVVGSAFADQLTGDALNNVLIGGAGADQLAGGDGEDLLIAGKAYDVNAAALLALGREWSRQDANFATRMAHLRLGGGLNGTFVLNASTVFDDGAVDNLTGGAGSDWFWATASQDLVNRTSEDQLN
jgi:hypothetical protein